jgi:2,4-dienoyl-CoA reductase-like NADH-dependent reductase (Old Yellow Enzyme family)
MGNEAVDKDIKALFAPKDINGLVAKNRFAVAPMTRITATDDGRATETMTRYYERFARGGFGTVITEGIYPDHAFSQAYLHQPGIADEAQAMAWKSVVTGIKAHGARAIAQLMHAGAISQGNRFRDHTVGPSAVQPKGRQLAFYHGKDRYARPAQITDEQIAEAIAGFADAAARAIDIAGFDAIEIHGANGYLLDQFLTDYTNTRRDRWGGSTRNRLRLALETFKAVRAKVGPSIPIGIRISQGKVNDFHHKWPGEEGEAEVIFGSLADVGADFIHVTEFEAWQPAFLGGGSSLMRLAKRFAPKATILANGSLHDVAQAAAALNDGADIVTIGRGALANPDLPARLTKQTPLKSFDPAILGPIANIKDAELAV